MWQFYVMSHPRARIKYLLYICRFLLWAQSPRYFVLPSDEGARENNVRGPGTTLKIGRYTIFPYDTSIRGQRWLETCVVLNFPPFCQILAKIRDKKSPDLFFIRNRENSHCSIFRERIGIRLLWRESDLSWPSNRVFVSNQRRPSDLDESPDLKRPYKWRDLRNWEPCFIFSPAVKYRNYIYWFSILTAGKLLVGRTKSGTLLLGPKYCDPRRIEVS